MGPRIGILDLQLKNFGGRIKMCGPAGGIVPTAGGIEVSKAQPDPVSLSL